MAHPELDVLLNALIPFAQQMLTKHREFHPFGAAVATDGQVRLMAGAAESEQPPAQQVIETLRDGFRQFASAGEVNAVGLCYDGRVIPPGQSEKVDAIMLELEHSNGEAAHLALPYTIGWFGKVSYGVLVAVPSEPKVFCAGGAA